LVPQGRVAATGIKDLILGHIFDEAGRLAA
jgi:hypothetical protein